MKRLGAFLAAVLVLSGCAGKPAVEEAQAPKPVSSAKQQMTMALKNVTIGDSWVSVSTERADTTRFEVGDNILLDPYLYCLVGTDTPQNTQCSIGFIMVYESGENELIRFQRGIAKVGNEKIEKALVSTPGQNVECHETTCTHRQVFLLSLTQTDLENLSCFEQEGCPLWITLPDRSYSAKVHKDEVDALMTGVANARLQMAATVERTRPPPSPEKPAGEAKKPVAVKKKPAAPTIDLDAGMTAPAAAEPVDPNAEAIKPKPVPAEPAPETAKPPSDAY